MPVTLLITGISDFNFAFVHKSPSCFKPRSQWRAWGPSRFVLAVPMTHRVSFPAPTSLAADTDFHSLSSALGFTVLSVSLLVRQGQRRDHSQHASEQPPSQVPLGQQQPVIAQIGRAAC